MMSTLTERATKLEARIRDEARHFPSVLLSFGLEHSVAAALCGLTQKGMPHLASAPAPARAHGKLRSLLVRPATEPIIASYQHKFSQDQSDLSAIEAFGSCLFGSPRTIRTKQVKATWSGLDEDIVFSPPQTIHPALNGRAKRRIDDFDAPLLWAVARYLEFLFVHPFPDGNGRTGRALLNCDIAACLQTDGLILPLGPAFALNGRKIATDFSLHETDEYIEGLNFLILEQIELALDWAGSLRSFRKMDW